MSMNIFNIYIHNSPGKQQENLEFMVDLNFYDF